ncbi:MAG: DUF4197 domain-containing protein [Erythrobacter sp.]
MDNATSQLNRRTLLIGAGASGLLAALPASAHAQNLGGLGLSSILGKATDSALDKLAKPGAFYDDEDIRIGLPILGSTSSGGSGGGLLGNIFGAARNLGVIPGLDGIIRGINNAAGDAAGEAKPIFRDAIDGLSFSDAPGIIKEQDGGTQYLRSSSNDSLHAKLQPLIDSALESAGIHTQIEKLADTNSIVRQAGISREGVNKSVTDQGLDGIFSYVGNEERNFRKNPIGNLGGALGDLLGQ